MELKQKIEEMLKKNPQGLSISDIERKFEVDRVSIKVSLAHLIGEKKVRERKVGNTLLHYHKTAFKVLENIE